MFSGNLDRNIMDFMDHEEELLITFEKDTVEDAHIAASESIPLINMSVIPNFNDLEAFIGKDMTNMWYGGTQHLALKECIFN